MPRKPIVSRTSSLDKADTVERIQTSLGLVRTVETKDGPRELLTSTELGRRAGLPGRWGNKGANLNRVAEAAGLLRRHNGRWYPSAVAIIESAAKSFDWQGGRSHEGQSPSADIGRAARHD